MTCFLQFLSNNSGRSEVIFKWLTSTVLFSHLAQGFISKDCIKDTDLTINIFVFYESY